MGNARKDIPASFEKWAIRFCMMGVMGLFAGVVYYGAPWFVIGTVAFVMLVILALSYGIE